MAANSSGELRTTTWNPVTGCDRVSAGCDNCYALALAKRLKGMGAEKYQTDGDPTTSGPGFGVATHPKALRQPYQWHRPRVVFVTSMGDLFHPGVPLAFIRDVFTVMGETPQHTYQLLTKRPGRARKSRASSTGHPISGSAHRLKTSGSSAASPTCAPRRRSLKFLSCEPLLGALDTLDLDGIGWVIVAGESGPNHRAMKAEWATSIRDQCLRAKVPFYFKQWGGRTARATGRELEGQLWNEMPAIEARSPR